MSIGSVLVQPQRLRRARGPQIALGGEVVAVAGRMSADGTIGVRIAELLFEALQTTVERLFNERRANMEAAAPRLRRWLEGLSGPGTFNVDVSDPRAALGLARQLIGAVADGLENPAAAALRPHIAELVDIIENELGLTPQALLDEIWAALTAVADQLGADQPDESAADRATRLEVARLVRRLSVRFRAEFTLPRLNADRIVATLVGFLANAQARRFAARLRCVADALGAFLDGTITVTELVELPDFAEFRSIGAAAAAGSDRYLWYASWLLDSDVVLNRERTEITVDGAVRHRGTNLTAADLPHFRPGHDPYFTFPHTNVETAETVAYVSAVVRDGLQVFLHAISLEEGDFVSNAFNLWIGALLGLARGVGQRPYLPWWAEFLVFVPTTLLASLEGRHTEGGGSQNAQAWLTLMGPDVGEMLWYRYLTTRARNVVLAGITLINHDPNANPEPDNRGHAAGMADVFTMFSSLIMVALYPREDWGVVDLQGTNNAPNWSFIFGWFIFGSLAMTVLGRLLGGLTAAAFSRSFDVYGWFFDRRYSTSHPATQFTMEFLRVFEHMFAHMTMMYMLNDGSTDGGRYNPGADAFAGYPEPVSGSPYTLPYPAGQSCYVGQGNQGMFSHNFLNGNQVYAYDFSLDQDDPILASRSGTVADYYDFVPDDTDPDATEQATAAAAAAASGTLVGGQTNNDTWNFIAIRHDTTEDGTEFGPDTQAAVNGAVASGGATMDIDNATTPDLWGGDVFTVAGDATQYVVTNPGPLTPVGGAFTGVTFVPASVAGFADDAVISFQHRVRPDPAHDRGAGGAVVRTYSVYGHGRLGSVRAAFAARGIAANQIIGQVVRRGQPIMASGDTGVSFHNHLHMHVVPGPPPNAPPAPGMGAVGRAAYGVPIPFVFRDVDNFLGPAGVCTKLNWYTSETEVLP